MPVGLGRMPRVPGRFPGGRVGRGGGRRGGGIYGVFLAMRLVNQIVALEHKPPVTLALVALMSAIFFGGGSMLGASLTPRLTCFPSSFSPGAIVANGQLTQMMGRAFWSTLVHADDFHLLYNMSSFLYKGLALEQLLGSPSYLLLIIFIWVTSKMLVFPLSLVLPASMTAGCSVGWSGIIFGLKAIVSSDDRFPNQQQRIFGLGSLPGGWITPWLELGLISLMVPQASFVGHLAGLLAGLLWLMIERFRVMVLDEMARQEAREAEAWREIPTRPQFRTGNFGEAAPLEEFARLGPPETFEESDQLQPEPRVENEGESSGQHTDDARRAAADAAVRRMRATQAEATSLRRRDVRQPSYAQNR